MKRNLLLGLILGIMLIGFVSAYYGYYGRFSFSDLLDEIDSSTMLLGAVFIISFALLNFSLSKFFKDRYGEPNKPIVGVVSFVVSLFITWGINKSDFDIESIFYNIGFSEGFLYTFLPLILLGAFIFVIIKWRGKGVILVGLFFIAISFFVYEKGLTLFLGLLFGIIGAIIWYKRPKKPKPSKYYPYRY